MYDYYLYNLATIMNDTLWYGYPRLSCLHFVLGTVLHESNCLPNKLICQKCPPKIRNTMQHAMHPNPNWPKSLRL